MLSRILLVESLLNLMKGKLRTHSARATPALLIHNYIFFVSRETWSKAVKCLSTLDALISLAKFSTSQENMCRPCVVPSRNSFINIVDGRHPCLDPAKYIANSCVLGSEDGCMNEGNGTFLLLTGANMGGKSTTMKQTGLIAILAQIVRSLHGLWCMEAVLLIDIYLTWILLFQGCYVPATSCTMSLIDRVFTRIGAADNIAEGESTFFVELSETSAILQHSSWASLILMDELGRGITWTKITFTFPWHNRVKPEREWFLLGTATHDGNAIAYAVASALSQRGARTIFSTHYHSLVSALKDKPSIQVGHMVHFFTKKMKIDYILFLSVTNSGNVYFMSYIFIVGLYGRTRGWGWGWPDTGNNHIPLQTHIRTVCQVLWIQCGSRKNRTLSKLKIWI